MNYLVIYLSRPLMIIIKGRKKMCEMVHLLSSCRKCLHFGHVLIKEQCYTNCRQCEPLASHSRSLTDGYSLLESQKYGVERPLGEAFDLWVPCSSNSAFAVM